MNELQVKHSKESSTNKQIIIPRVTEISVGHDHELGGNVFCWGCVTDAQVVMAPYPTLKAVCSSVDRRD